MTRTGFVSRSVATLATVCLFDATPAWAQAEVDKLLPDDGAALDYFGADVDICGDVAVVGARQGQLPATMAGPGAAYIFRQTETQNGIKWPQEATLTVSDGAIGDFFGAAVAICGDTAVIGAPRHNSSAGSVYVFDYVGGSNPYWDLTVELTADSGANPSDPPDANPADNFGAAVAIDGNVIVVGAFGDDDKGSAYVFTKNGSTWSQTTKLTDSDVSEDDRFGAAVAISGYTIVVGSQFDDDNGSSSGSVYVFDYLGGSWQTPERPPLKLTAGGAEDQFGCSVSVSGDSIAVGAFGDNSGAGAAYVYRVLGTDWSLEQKVTANDAALSANFGNSVAIDGDDLIVGAFLETFQTGSVYAFERSGTTWSQGAKLFASDATGFDQFGGFVATDGVHFVAGAAGNDDFGTASGSAYIFELEPETTPPTVTAGTIDSFYCSIDDAQNAAIAATTATDTESGIKLVSAITFGSCASSIVQVTATDWNDNVAGVLYFTAIDDDPLEITAPDDATVTVIDPDAPLLPSQVGDGTSATSLDVCDPSPVIDYEDLVVFATDTEPMQIVRTWTATDSCGNSVSADQTIVVDLADPDIDTDMDRVTDFDEVLIYSTDPADADTDADGLDDGEEIEMAASNGGCPNVLVPDSDGDTRLDGDEVEVLGTSPCDADTDGDGITDDLDPMPTGPSVTTELIAEGIADLRAVIATTDLGAFKGHRIMHKRVRRAILWWTLRKAEHALDCNRPVLARRLVQIVLWRVDGERRPLRDWVVDATVADAIEADAEMLIFLLDVVIDQ